ncbi:MAG: hypothetical protein JST21_04695 [Bacteroidetes bacterium]|nr:hypothetical protein [Bacteroidota bacterium]
MLPRVKINFENGNLNLVAPSDDCAFGIVATGVAVASTFALATPYKVSSMDEVATLGITGANNPLMYKILSEFFAEAGDGIPVYIMGVPDTMKLSDMVDYTNAAGARKLFDYFSGKLRGLFISRKPAGGYTFTAANGLDPDVALARTNAQTFADNYATSKYAPMFVVIEGYGFTGVPLDLTDLTTESHNRVSVLLGDTVASSNNAAIGVIAGRMAISPVQRNIGRVKDGPLKPLSTFLFATPTELADVATVNDKGYITFRTFVGQSGYYFNDDFTAALPTDDYCHLTARRTIDKAYRIAYATLLQWLLDEVQINTDGTLPATVVKAWQKQVESDIAIQMTAKGELSGDITTGDRGVQCYIDESQNIVATSLLKVTIRVRPFGYPRYIDVYLGFTVIPA